MIDVRIALLALDAMGVDEIELARALHVSPFLVTGWRDGAAISRPALRMLRGWVGHELLAHNAADTTGHAWNVRGALLRRAYDALTPDPTPDLVDRIRAVMRSAGSLTASPPASLAVDHGFLTPAKLAADVDRLLAPFRHPDHELHNRIDRTFS